ncbi:MAG: thiamine diphosphokinase [Oscillochloris sp.]|nr:thiamine diphosphokinase [Oscillochloris sp.]
MYVIIVANAPEFQASPFLDRLRAADLVIAADGGGNALYVTGFVPHLVVGDLDSLDPAAAEYFRTTSAEVRRYPAEKDETDLELALLIAIERGATQIDILGAIGGRWDQGLANVAMLALPELASVRVRLCDLTQEAFLVRATAEIQGQIGDVVSLLPLGGAVHGITTRGLYYPLEEATLRFERSRGVSNVMTASPAHVAIREGLLLVIRQGFGGR